MRSPHNAPGRRLPRPPHLCAKHNLPTHTIPMARGFHILPTPHLTRPLHLSQRPHPPSNPSKNGTPAASPKSSKLLQHYQYGEYPDPAAESVTASRSGEYAECEFAAADGKRGSFRATIAFAERRVVAECAGAGGYWDRAYKQ
ncbi:hypothetical protein AJ80_01495 [Polytolypa hystricis UAMH7299]|uniref:Uncharacterized protein n=1 Tax=Polytolypa hystricis (strain UAMH7299) TaxID=1447883 RepID=A0A2B7Z1G1_POLH7|nr:hypothetical protein AJ80_01495 [Polytolypa hystricis UAMH7299]